MVVKHLGRDRLKGLFTVQITRMLCGSRSLKDVDFPATEVLGAGASEDEIADQPAECTVKTGSRRQERVQRRPAYERNSRSDLNGSGWSNQLAHNHHQ
jgi:hypothetical protein